MTDRGDARVPFTTSQWRRTGGDPSILRRRSYTSLMRSVWIRSDALDADSLYRAALLIHPPSAYLSGLSGAAARGLPVPRHAFVHVTVPRAEDRRFRPQIKCHVRERPRLVSRVRGMRVSGVVDLFIDCAAALPLVDLVVLGDAIVRRSDLTAAQLLRACRASTDYYAGLARNAAELVRDGVDSVMETRLRLLIVLAGLPEPTVDFRVRRDDGTWSRRYDLYYEAIGLIVEYDGKQHAESPEQWAVDLDRREEIDDSGRRILVVTSDGIFRHPERTLMRVRRQLVLRGWGKVPPIDDSWRGHFDDSRELWRQARAS